jgi:hypothetical protein
MRGIAKHARDTLQIEAGLLRIGAKEFVEL